ncbi:MAG: TIGR04086 family membrane protein [Clostridiales bacterium]|jgi:putative membrane protein (TIGR04086 family)|nr:TIGR04086 family membrane protein [Clostridiales bacterium]HOB64501.1 TIGR04086 family membrane protein [Clostridia bacterium]HOK81426.1 TIGR04086 family membrane protein [Clostridia bacterium]HOL60726.1 TIGR04086 family membrane protein [Clostridia bacterium]HPO53301.1 TIGR04086 family membrane protein [Clostridia bacterium]
MKTKPLKAKSLSINKTTIFDIIRGTLLAAVISLLGVLILALICKLTTVGNEVILPINQVLKILSILLGCIFGIKEKVKGAIKGGTIGLLYSLLSIFIFLILNKTLDGSSINYIDIVSGLAAGVLSGIIAVNFRKK